MSNHNKIRPVDKNNLNGKCKILFSTLNQRIAIYQWSLGVYKFMVTNL